MDLLPESTFAPTLYGLGNSIEEWATGALRLARNDHLIVVGCSVGGSCALEVAAVAPERVAALVLIGTKAKHHPDPILHSSALNFLKNKGIDRAWAKYWAPLFSKSVDQGVVEAARKTAFCQLPKDIAHGLNLFHLRQSRDQFAAEFQKQIVVVSGQDDVAPGPRASAVLAASAPHGCLHVIPSCGHYVPLERPKVLRGILSDLIAQQRKRS
jgi:pimeloyl-ACP methyl ester carboxylesterase